MNAPITPPAIPPYHHTPLFPARARHDAVPQARRRRRARRKGHGPGHAGDRARGAARAGRGRLHRHQSSAAPGAPEAAAQNPRRPGGVAPTTSSSPTISSRTPTSPPAACCRCARTPAPPSSWARRAAWCSPTAPTRARWPRARATPTSSAICAIRSWRRSPCSRRRTPSRTCRRRSRSTPRARSAYKFLFIAKGGGSANKSFLFQATPSILTHDRMLAFLKEKVLTLGTAACPPYHLAIVIGGTSAELTMKTVKLASTHYYDTLPTKGSEAGHAFRDLEMEQEVLKMTQSTGVGAQFGGKYFCHDVRVIRLPRHGASLPIGLGRVLRRRPPGAGQDHQGRRVPRRARASSGAISARGRSGKARRRRW